MLIYFNKLKNYFSDYPSNLGAGSRRFKSSRPDHLYEVYAPPVHLRLWRIQIPRHKNRG